VIPVHFQGMSVGVDELILESQQSCTPQVLDQRSKIEELMPKVAFRKLKKLLCGTVEKELIGWSLVGVGWMYRPAQAI